MSERLQLLGLLESKKLDAARMRLKVEGLRDALRNNLPRHEPVEGINGELAAAQAVELAATLTLYRDLLDEIAAIKRDLGV